MPPLVVDILQVRDECTRYLSTVNVKREATTATKHQKVKEHQQELHKALKTPFLRPEVRRNVSRWGRGGSQSHRSQVVVCWFFIDARHRRAKFVPPNWGPHVSALFAHKMHQTPISSNKCRQQEAVLKTVSSCMLYWFVRCSWCSMDARHHRAKCVPKWGATFPHVLPPSGSKQTHHPNQCSTRGVKHM